MVEGGLGDVRVTSKSLDTKGHEDTIHQWERGNKIENGEWGGVCM